MESISPHTAGSIGHRVMMGLEHKRYSVQGNVGSVLHLQELGRRDAETTALPQLPAVTYLVGSRLYAVTFGLCLSLFMITMETSMASTSILVITNQLAGYMKSSWVFTAYLLTYSGFPVIFAKVSDILGRKPLVLFALFVFVLFSGACGASQTLIQLITFRWIQGIGGSGIYAVATIYFFELVPPEKWSLFSAFAAFSVALGLIVAPIIGGGIAIANWRWIFLINVPIGVVALVVLVFSMPANLSNEPAAAYKAVDGGRVLPREILRRIDFLGAVLLLGTCIFLSTALQEAAVGNSFASGEVLPLLIISAIMCIALLAWQWYITTRRTIPEPILPWRFFQSRECFAIILNAFLNGSILYVIIVQLPQRFMTVNGKSPFAAGVRLLPYGILVPGGSILAAVLMSKLKVPPMYILILGGLLQIAGIVGLSKSPTSFNISSSQYGFEILAGTGTGFFSISLVLLLPYVMENRDLATGAGVILQFRMLGGLIGLSIVSSAATPYITSHLSEILSQPQLTALLERTDTLSSLPNATRAAARSVFGHGYNLQMIIMIGFAVAQIPATLLMWRKKPIVLQTGEREDSET